LNHIVWEIVSSKLIRYNIIDVPLFGVCPEKAIKYP